MLGALARTSIRSTNGCTGDWAVDVAACTAVWVDAAEPAPLPACPPAAELAAGVPGAPASGAAEAAVVLSAGAAPGLGPNSRGGGRMASMVEM